MNPRQLELLRQVVEAGSFTEAARRSGVSQPAVSQAMALLAEQAGEPLFVRRGRGLQATERALALARLARSIDDGLREARMRQTARPARILRAGLAPAAGLMYGAAMVEALARVPAKPLLSIMNGPAPVMLEQLARGDLDLVIAPRPRGLNRPGLRHQVMYPSQPTIYARAGNPLASAGSLRAIARAEWAVAGSAGTPGNVIEEAFRVRRWRPPRVAVQCADYAMLLRIVGATDLLGVVSHPSLVTEARKQGIVPVQVAEGLPHYEVCLFWYEPAGRPWPAGMDEVLSGLEALAQRSA